MILLVFKVAILAAFVLGCGGPVGSRALDEEHLQQIFEFGRRVHQPPRMVASKGFSLQSLPNAETFALEHAHDPAVPGLIQFDTTTSPVTTLSQLRAFAATWIAEHARDLGCLPDDLRVGEAGEQWLSDRVLTLHFDRFFGDLPVRDAFVQFSFALQSDGSLRLREVLNRSHGDIRLENTYANRASRTEIDEVLASLNLKFLSTRDLIYPQSAEDSAPRMLKATEVLAWDEVENTLVTLTVAHGSLATIEAYRHRYEAKLTATAKIMERSYLDPQSFVHPLSFASLRNLNTNTDADGVFESEIGNQTSLSFQLTGPRATSLMSGQNVPYIVSAAFDAGTGLVKVEPDANSLVALNAFMSIQRMNSFARRHLRESEAAILGRNIQITSNIAGSCNAFYDGSISLFSAGQGCANMALVNDVAYHEWGHALDDSVGRSRGITDGAFSEGIGDILAAYYTESPDMGVGFLQGNARGIRQLKNNLRYPNNRGGVHQEGLTIAGAFWSLREALIDRYGDLRGAYLAERFFLRHLLVTDSYLESFQSVMTLDDDDGNPMTPSPNRCLITEVFAKHGLAVAEPNCEDLLANDKRVALDQDLALTVLEVAQNGVVMAAAADAAADARQMFACIGTEFECQKSLRRDLTFALDGQKNQRIIFRATGAISVAEQQSITLFALGDGDQLIGSRTFVFHGK